MAIQDMTPADLAAVVNDNDGFGGGNGWWIILLFLFLGWGNNGWGGNNAANDAGMAVYPLMENQQNLFNGFGNLQNAICSGFANAETAATARQMADMQQEFALQTAMMQGFNAQQAQLAQCCCDNRLATCQTQNIVQNEGAATRLAIQNQTQQILDKMCQQEIDALKRENENLRTMVNMQNLAASQTAQTAQLIADNTAQTQYIVNRVAPYPIPAYTVANPVTPAATAAG